MVSSRRTSSDLVASIRPKYRLSNALEVLRLLSSIVGVVFLLDERQRVSSHLSSVLDIDRPNLKRLPSFFALLDLLAFLLVTLNADHGKGHVLPGNEGVELIGRQASRWVDEVGRKLDMVRQHGRRRRLAQRRREIGERDVGVFGRVKSEVAFALRRRRGSSGRG